MLRVAVHVQWSQGTEVVQVGAVSHSVSAVAIRRSRRRIHESRIASETPLSQIPGEAVIVPHEVCCVTLGGRRACTHVEHEVEFAELAGFQSREQVSGVDVIVEVKRYEVPPLLVSPEEIGDDDAIDAALIQLMDEPAADEAGTACDEDSCRRIKWHG